MSARLLADLETADAVVRAIDGVEGFEVSSVSVAPGLAISIHLASGTVTPALASILGEVHGVRDRPSMYSAWDFRWRGTRVTVYGDPRPTSQAGAA